MSLSPRVLVGGIVRMTQAAGGLATVLAKGGEEAGAILLVLAERGQASAVLERLLGLDGYRWQRVGPSTDSERASYLERRRARDPDLWIVELDIPEAERFAAESFGFD